MKHLIEFSLNFLIAAFIIFELVHEFRKIEKPKNKYEFFGLFLACVILAALSQFYWGHFRGQPYFLTEFFGGIYNSIANPK